MTTHTIFVKRSVKDSLPKKKGMYFIYSKDGGIATDYFSGKIFKWKHTSFWLEERTLELPDEKEIALGAKNHYHRTSMQSPQQSFTAGAKYILDQIEKQLKK